MRNERNAETPCFACRYCRYHPTHRVLWCYWHQRDALKRCDHYEREPGAEG